MGSTIIGALAALVGAWIGAKITSDAAKNQLLFQYKANFSAVFSEALFELHDLQPEEVGESLDILKQHFPQHLGAYLKLRAVLSGEDRVDLDRRWAIYTKDKEHDLKEEKEIYRFSRLLVAENPEQENMLAIKQVNNLIDIAT